MSVGYINLATYKVFSYGKINSTQTVAHNFIADGAGADHIAIVADTQTAGRGRYRRNWVSKPGNLYVSFIYECAERDPRMSYAVAVAMAETVNDAGANARIKWPNDILVDGKKIAGVLIEYNARFVVVGIGINIKHSPRVEKYQTAKLSDYGDADRNCVLGVLMRKLDRWLRADFVDVRARWMELAVGLSRDVTYRGMSAELIGINDAGALVLRRGAEYVLAYGDEITMQKP